MNNFYVLHDSQNLYFRNPFGAVKTGSNINLALEAEGCDEAVIEIIRFDGSRESIPMERHPKDGTWNVFLFKGTIKICDTPGIINYYFTLRRGWQTIFYGDNWECLGGSGQIYYENPKWYQITVFKDFKVPKWYKEGIIYQIFVDRFYNGNENGEISNAKSNCFIYGKWYDNPMYIKDETGKVIRWDFFGGNLKGVLKKLSYIKSLGITTIYMNPIFEAASSHKYDVGNYKKIDPMFGDEELFKNLCKEAEKLGMKVILDGVFSHTGADSLYFNRYGNYDSLGAFQSKDSPYYSWYRFKNYPYDYEAWWGFENQPNVDELNPSYIEYIINGQDSVVEKWMKLGASGWRLDVADELPDEFICELKKKIKEVNKESVLIGEVWEDASNKVSYGKRRKYFLGEELDSVTGYPFRDIILSFLIGYLDSHGVRRRFMSLYENYPKENFYSSMNVLGTHDTERILTALSGNGKGEENSRVLLKLAVAFQMTFPGVPLIYYGDEAGVMGGRDPENRKTYPWGKEDKDILSWYRKLTHIRDHHQVFKRGDFRFFETHEDVLCFKRKDGDSKAIVIINRNTEASIKVEFGEVYGKYRNLFKDEGVYYSPNGVMRVHLKPMEVKALINI
ncbi:alpha-amylase [Clostridium polyendosporum]|uniref:Alpha-amylase n=1 Tax=Clostridium polyendosporum TaxID=69208 RepID=A0A919S3D4_9CLOT|nr:glycoside hydrolase family 13 protein [Clostridium polyendosporum]GIM30505.1 alpha-amylase [Clostridium polyendosporum]